MAASPEFSILPFRQLFELGRIRSQSVVADEDRQSLPIPRMRDGMPIVQFLFFPSRPSPGTTQLFAANYLMELDARDGRVRVIREFKPEEIGLRVSSGGELGQFALPEGVTWQEYMADRDRLFELYDAIAPALLQGRVQTVDRRAVTEYRTVFDRVSEPPMRPYYEAIGVEWFRLVNRIAPHDEE